MEVSNLTISLKTTAKFTGKNSKFITAGSLALSKHIRTVEFFA